MSYKSGLMMYCRQTTLVLICSSASKKNECGAPNELLKPSMWEVQIDLNNAYQRRELDNWKSLIYKWTQNLINLSKQNINGARFVYGQLLYYIFCNISTFYQPKHHRNKYMHDYTVETLAFFRDYNYQNKCEDLQPIKYKIYKSH